MNAAVVVPTNRPERIASFIEAWRGQVLQPDVRLLVIEDFPERQSTFPAWVEHYCHEDINRELGDSAWCIPKRSGGIRSFGFWKAAQDETIDMIVSLDDDVLPLPLPNVNLIDEHWRALNQGRHLRWWPVAHIRTRGYPYLLASTTSVLNHGLWEGVPDLDAREQLIRISRNDPLEDYPVLHTWHPKMAQHSALVPPGMYYSMCIMNVAFRREFAPFMFMPPLPEGIKRWDDIWCGVIAKRIADLQSWAVTSGQPTVYHERASDPLSNLKQEFLGYGINEEVWKVVDRCGSPSAEPLTAYEAISVAMEARFPILKETAEAMRCWAGLWNRPVDDGPKVMNFKHSSRFITPEGEWIPSMNCGCDWCRDLLARFPEPGLKCKVFGAVTEHIADDAGSKRDREP